MRTIFFTLILMLTLVGCGGKNDAPIDSNATDVAAESSEEAATAQDEEISSAAEVVALNDAVGIDVDTIIEPVGEVHLFDGTIIELTMFEKIGKYYIYISGKLNGRSSTVISLTRLDDLKRWAGIQFKDKNTFSILTKGEKELAFEDSRIYLGSASHTTFTFHTADPDTYELSKVEVKKEDVKVILIK
ncbi:MAG: hypothetical protein OCC46_12730 [Pseudodesulfovibrio sp.]